MAQVNPTVAWTALIAWTTLAESEGRKAHALRVEGMDYQLVMVARWHGLFDADVNHHTAAAQQQRETRGATVRSLANRSPQ